jgi:hypothetical protein
VCCTLTKFSPPPAELPDIDFVSRTAFPKGFLFLAYVDEKSKFLDFPTKNRFFVRYSTNERRRLDVVKFSATVVSFWVSIDHLV